MIGFDRGHRLESNMLSPELNDNFVVKYKISGKTQAILVVKAYNVMLERSKIVKGDRPKWI
jgi:hypothetical protein